MINIIKKNKKLVFLVGSLFLGGAASLIFLLSFGSKEEVLPLAGEEEVSINFDVFKKEEFQKLEMFDQESEIPEEKGRENPFEKYEIVEEEVEEETEELSEEELPEEEEGEETEELPEELPEQ